MNATIAAFLATAMIAAPVAIANGGFPGLPDQAAYGHCMAYTHADENATANATPFQNDTAPDDCEDLKPGDQADQAREDGQAFGMAQADEHHPDHAGADRGNATADDHRQDDDAREDGRAHGQSQADERRP